MTEQRMIDDIAEACGVGGTRGGIDLTAWEEDFVDSIKERLSYGDQLTPRQKDRLREIWDRI
jgi:hypothetical protein